MPDIGESYVTLEELKFYLTIDVTTYDSVMTDALDSASREIERITNRQFNLATTESVRHYKADRCLSVVKVDDFIMSGGFLVETSTYRDGAYAPIASTGMFTLYPEDGVVGSVPGWPYSELRSDSGFYSLSSPTYGYPVFDYWVRVTAQWGWAAVPAPVRQACLVMAAETFQMKDAPFGVAGSDQFGSILRVRDNEVAKAKLRRYTRDLLMVG